MENKILRWQIIKIVCFSWLCPNFWNEVVRTANSIANSLLESFSNSIPNVNYNCFHCLQLWYQKKINIIRVINYINFSLAHFKNPVLDSKLNCITDESWYMSASNTPMCYMKGQTRYGVGPINFDLCESGQYLSHVLKSFHMFFFIWNGWWR